MFFRDIPAGRCTFNPFMSMFSFITMLSSIPQYFCWILASIEVNESIGIKWFKVDIESTKLIHFSPVCISYRSQSFDLLCRYEMVSIWNSTLDKNGFNMLNWLRFSQFYGTVLFLYPLKTSENIRGLERN